MIDVKDMDLINVRCGNEKGDMLLIETANLLKQLENLDCHLFTRYGGDSFVFVLRDKSRVKAVKDFLTGIPKKVLEKLDCPKSFEFTIANTNSKGITNAQYLVYQLKKIKTRNH